MAVGGALVLAPGANAATFEPGTYGDVPGSPNYPGDYPSASAQQSAYEQGYARGMRDAEDRDADRYFDRADREQTYAPASAAQTGPNTADAPRASEASTSQTEACGTNPGENNHTLGLPKLVNVNMC
jgi:hypothetical protein